MSLDLILRAPNRATLVTFAQNHPVGNPLLGADGLRLGVEYCPYNGTGNVVLKRAEYDQDGNEISPAQVDTGYTVIMRLHGEVFAQDQRTPTGGEDGSEQWHYSKVARYIKNRGVEGTILGITYYELDSVRILKPSDVTSYLQANGGVSHFWQGGNSF